MKSIDRNKKSLAAPNEARSAAAQQHIPSDDLLAFAAIQIYR